MTTRGLDPAAIQNELYIRLLRKDKTIVTPFHKGQYLRLAEARALVLGAGGVPCYSLGAIAVRELAQCGADAGRLADQLRALKVSVVDFLPMRTEPEILKIYARIFTDRNFCVTFGSGHNEPERRPLVPRFSSGEPLDEELSRTGWEGACLLAAHQELRKQNREGIVDGRGNWLVTAETRMNFIAIGEKAIQKAVEG